MVPYKKLSVIRLNPPANLPAMILPTFPGAWRLEDEEGAEIASSHNINEIETGIWREMRCPCQGGTVTWYVRDFG